MGSPRLVARGDLVGRLAIPFYKGHAVLFVFDKLPDLAAGAVADISHARAISVEQAPQDL